jgi:HEAT repeat protein
VHVQTNASVNVATTTAIRVLMQNDPTNPAYAGQDGKDDRATMLVKLLRTDSSSAVRRIAAWGLMKFTDTPTVSEALSHALASDADDRVRTMAAWAMVEGNAKSTGPALEAALQGEKSSDVREMAAWGLGTRGTASSAAALGRLVSSDPSAHVRSTAAWALGQLDLSTAPKGLIDALSDSSADVRFKASWALSQIGDKAALPALRKAMDKETHEGALRAQLRAVIAGGITPEELAPMLSSKHPEARAAATRALSGDKSSYPWPWPWPRPMPNP